MATIAIRDTDKLIIDIALEYGFSSRSALTRAFMEEYGCKRGHELLKRGGVFGGFAYHAGSDKKRKELTAEIQELYKAYMRPTQTHSEYSEAEAARISDIALKYGFTDATYSHYYMEKHLTLMSTWNF